ncbi:MAG: VWA domain-containing protein [Bacteroidota bacterium]
MLRFAHSEYLYALYLIPVIIFFYWITQKINKKLLKQFASEKLHRVLFPKKSPAKGTVKFVLTVLIFILLIVALANPQVGSKIEEVKQVGIDVYILLDVSLSMTAEDIKPSRLEKAKHQIAKLIQRLQGDRLGLVVFSGEAYVQIPLTTDYAAANLFLNAVDVTSVPQPGTAIGLAIQLAMNSFKAEEETKKAVIIITDGEDHEGDLQEIVNEAVSKGINLYTIGLGSPSGVPIPVYNKAGVQIGYKKDRRDQVVLTKLNEATLKEIAERGNGQYYRASNTEDELELIYNDLAKLDQTEFGATRITDYEDRYYYLLFPAILLLIAEIFISTNKSKLMFKYNEKS